MLWTVTVFVVLWVLALLTSFTLNGLIHVLPVLAVVSILIRIFQRRRAV